MVQARQLRVDHPDFHYASALFQYEREMAVRYREYSNLIFIDDKHHCKVGKPDGGPDHQVKFIKTQLALISLFLALDLNYLVAVRIPPGHSWKNPVERIMSILNLGLQCVGLMCQEMDVELEEIMLKCNSMNDIRKMAEKTPSLKEECYDEMEKAYYSANFLPVYFNCGSSEYITPVSEKQYPYCEAYTTDPNVSIKTDRTDILMKKKQKSAKLQTSHKKKQKSAKSQITAEIHT
ncbi:hypothetical protein RhiirC2_721477 [Rhizophagus irregularis]|uniref:Uncharacterized protein n=1 Tax=Rhizophagus irregularis TaxID=588596 RepID=A0A2N1M5Y5_9GLOM|nr:hypothetical protein RhiirC2_721477 [Rhizophagus irregularis]